MPAHAICHNKYAKFRLFFGRDRTGQESVNRILIVVPYLSNIAVLPIDDMLPAANPTQRRFQIG